MAFSAPGSAGYQGKDSWYRQVAIEIQGFFTNIVTNILNIGHGSIITTNYTITDNGTAIEIQSTAGQRGSLTITGLDPAGQAQINLYGEATHTHGSYIFSDQTGALTVGSEVDLTLEAGAKDMVLDSTSGSLTMPGPLIFDATTIFMSAEITADGTAQATAHGLGRTPVIAIAYSTNTVAAAALSAVTSSSTTCTVTGTNLQKYRILAL